MLLDTVIYLTSGFFLVFTMEAVIGSRLLGEIEEMSLEEVSSISRNWILPLFSLAYPTTSPHYRPYLRIIMTMG